MKIKHVLMTAAAVAVLSACTVAHPAPAPQLTFANFQPVNLNVQAAKVEDAYTQPNDPQDVSGQFVLPPSEAVKRYAANRFHAEGAGNGQFVISIKDARVHMRQITQDSKVLKWADVGTEDEYHVWLALDVVSQPSGFGGRQTTSIKFDRTLVMPSSVTLEERDLRQTQFLEKLIADADSRISDALDQTPAIRQ